MATEQPQTVSSDASQGAEELQKKINELLKDPLARTVLLQRLNPQPVSQSSTVLDGAAPTPYLTPSGMAAGSGWPVFPVPFPFAPTSGFPPFWTQHATGTQLTPHGAGDSGGRSISSNNAEDSIDPALPGASGLQNEEEQLNEDIIDPLSETVALEMVEFDPKVDSEDKWVPPKLMMTFLKSTLRDASQLMSLRQS